MFHKLALNDLFNILLYKIDRGIFCCTENILMYVKNSDIVLLHDD